MASFNIAVFVVAALILAVCCAAPTEGNSLIKIPSSCKGQRFCTEKPEGYDLLEEKINRALPEFLVKEFADRSGVETPSEPKLSPKEDWHNCPYVSKKMSMYLHTDEGNSSKTDIFVQTTLFQQSVDIVECATDHINVNSKDQCFQDLGISSLGMQSSCETTMAQRILYIYDIEKNKVVPKMYALPACCRCKVSYT